MLIWFVFSCLGNGIEHLVDFLKKFVSTTDKVIIVAMITGMVSIIGVVFTSVIAKIIDYRYNVKNTYMIKERYHMNNLYYYGRYKKTYK